MSQTTQLSELARALSRNRGTGMGIDPMLPAWKASVLRLSHGAPVFEKFSFLVDIVKNNGQKVWKMAKMAIR